MKPNEKLYTGTPSPMVLKGGVPRSIWTETGRPRLLIKDANFLVPKPPSAKGTLSSGTAWSLRPFPFSFPLFLSLSFLPSFLSLPLPLLSSFQVPCLSLSPLLSLVHEIMLHILPQNLICSLTNTLCKSDEMASIKPNFFLPMWTRCSVVWMPYSPHSLTPQMGIDLILLPMPTAGSKSNQTKTGSCISYRYTPRTEGCRVK